jgi:hypothetical protein
MQAPTKILRRLLGVQLLVIAGLFAVPSQAEEALDLLPHTDTFRFDARDTFYETRNYTGSFSSEVRGASQDIYFGQSRIANQYDTDRVIEKKGFHWALNQRGVELLFKF